MKKLTKLLTLLIVFSITFTISCSECNNENPRARVTNMTKDVISLKATSNQNNTSETVTIDPNKSSEFKTYTPGEVTYKITSNTNQETSVSFEVDFCSDYEVIFNNDGSIEIIPEIIE